MRFSCLTLILSAFSLPLSALEIEEQRTYPATDPQANLRILSTADIDVFEPIITAFQEKHPTFSIQYDVASSTAVMEALYATSSNYDLAISSAMDLQTKLANDGYTQSYSSDQTQAMPPWANWRDEVFAFTQEPAVLVISTSAFEGITHPTNREDLIDLLRNQPDVFTNRIGTYDVRRSGLGYLFATQDSRNTESYWQLTEVMGRLGARLYCCSGAMIEAVASGELALAYNVLGSYAQSRLKDTPGIKTVALDDFVSVMLRTAVIPLSAPDPQLSGKMIDFLISARQENGLPPIAQETAQEGTVQRPIRLGPGLLVFLDKMRKETFLRSWVSSMEQN